MRWGCSGVGLVKLLGEEGVGWDVRDVRDKLQLRL